MSQHSADAHRRRQSRVLVIQHRETITALRRAIEALAPYATHRVGCDARGDRKPCTCGLAERLAAAQRLCVPNNPPPTYTPRKFG